MKFREGNSRRSAAIGASGQGGKKVELTIYKKVYRVSGDLHNFRGKKGSSRKKTVGRRKREVDAPFWSRTAEKEKGGKGGEPPPEKSAPNEQPSLSKKGGEMGRGEC